MAVKAWYQYPRIDNFGVYPDPDGAFPKPDSNILCPDGSSITAIGGGIVSGVDTPGSGALPPYGHVVTILLSSPHNTLATHDAYLHMHSVSVSLGNFISVGQEVGKSGSNPQSSTLGFAFYPGDSYGFDKWQEYYQGHSTLDPRLNPVPYLDTVANSGPGSAIGTRGTVSDQSTDPFAAFAGFNTFFSNLNNLFSDPIRIFKIVLGSILFFAGVALAIQSLKPVQEAEGAALKAVAA